MVNFQTNSITLLNKWIKRYKNVTDSLWRRILVDKKESDLRNLILGSRIMNHQYLIWKNIIKPIKEICEGNSRVKKYVGYILGNENALISRMMNGSSVLL